MLGLAANQPCLGVLFYELYIQHLHIDVFFGLQPSRPSTAIGTAIAIGTEAVVGYPSECVYGHLEPVYKVKERFSLGSEIVLLVGIPEMVSVFLQLVTIRSYSCFPVACPLPPACWTTIFPEQPLGFSTFHISLFLYQATE